MIRLESVEKRFDDTVVIAPLSLEVKEGEFLTLLGPSGCGKTTLLRIIAGFESPTSGTVLLDGKPITHLPPYKRDMNMVFQQYALFPHMTVEENIRFGLKMKKVPAAEQKRRLEEALEYTNLTEYRRRKPHELSGGQQQRVAVARAIVNKPRVLLLDEPLSALDYQLRRKLQVELKNLQRNLGITFIYVTHDQEEAMTMSDRIAIMNRGVIEQIGTPEEIYLRPRSLFVATFVGENNVFRRGATTVAVRPENIRVMRESEAAGYEVREPVARAAGDDDAQLPRAGMLAAVGAHGGTVAAFHGAGARNGTGRTAVAGAPETGVATAEAPKPASAANAAAPSASGEPALAQVVPLPAAARAFPTGTVQDIVFMGGLRKTFIRVDGGLAPETGANVNARAGESGHPIVISCDTSGSCASLRIGERVTLRWEPEHEVKLTC